MLAVAGAGCAKPKAVKWETAPVDRGRITARVTATGTLSALVTVQVGSQVSGRVQQILVDYNSPVKKGQLIAKIDPQLFQAALEQARANHAAAQGNLTKAKVMSDEAQRQYKRTASLAENKLVSLADLDTADANAASARAQVAVSAGAVQQARAALHQAEVNMAYTKIISPTDGVVISRNVDVGQTVAASLQAPTLFVIAEDLRKMQVDTSVAEADVGKLRPGMEATFSVDAFPGERFVGKVRQIRNAAQTVQNVVTYDAVIDVDNADLKLRPGMTANVNFIYANREGVLRVPNAALRFRPSSDLMKTLNLPDEGQGEASGAGKRGRKDPGERLSDARTVWVLRNGVPQSEKIRVGTSDGTRTEVVEGNIKEGETVISDATMSNGKSSSMPLPGAGAPPPGARRMF